VVSCDEIALRKILHLGEIHARHTRTDAIFKSSIWKLKINRTRNTLNFVFVQWNYICRPLQSRETSPLSYRTSCSLSTLACCLRFIITQIISIL
jgi:hypothetical protein